MQDKIKVNLKFVVSQNSKPYFESSALTGDIPKIYFNVRSEDGMDIYFIVDGQQRINAIKEFSNNQFALLADADPINNIQVAGKTHDELDMDFLMMNFDNRNLHVVYLTNYSKDLNLMKLFQELIMEMHI